MEKDLPAVQETGVWSKLVTVEIEKNWIYYKCLLEVEWRESVQITSRGCGRGKCQSWRSAVCRQLGLSLDQVQGCQLIYLWFTASIIFLKRFFGYGPFLKPLLHLLQHSLAFFKMIFGVLATRRVGSQLPDPGLSPNPLHSKAQS